MPAIFPAEGQTATKLKRVLVRPKPYYVTIPAATEETGEHVPGQLEPRGKCPAGWQREKLIREYGKDVRA